jgi:hypothetical protein
MELINWNYATIAIVSGVGIVFGMWVVILTLKAAWPDHSRRLIGLTKKPIDHPKPELLGRSASGLRVGFSLPESLDGNTSVSNGSVASGDDSRVNIPATASTEPLHDAGHAN